MDETISEYQKMSGVELLEWIAFKGDYPQEAEMAFCVFCDRYQRRLLQKSEIHCCKFNYNETIALMAVECTFNKVWNKAITFDMKKANTKNIDSAIYIWMGKILYTQITLFKVSDKCAQPTSEEDLSLIYDVDQLIVHTEPNDIETQKILKTKLAFVESVMERLSPKHRVIYLTYLAYGSETGRNIPRSVSNKLKEELELTQASIRVYKKQVSDLIKNYTENESN